MTDQVLRDRVGVASSRLTELQKKSDDLDKKLGQANSIEEMAELSRMLTEVRSDIEYIEMARDQTMAQLDAEVARVKSSDYKAGIKKMDQIKADNERRAKTIDESMHMLMDQIQDLQDSCRQYDALYRQHVRTASPFGLFTAYGWISLLHGRLHSLRHDMVYQARRL